MYFQGRWVTAFRICVKFMTDSDNKKRARMVEFAGGRMLQSEYKVIFTTDRIEYDF